MTETITYPLVNFKLGGANYCISSEYIEIMSTDNRFYPLPDTADYLLGVTELNGQMIPGIDMRRLLGLPAMKEELEEFQQVKEAHRSWVAEFERCMESGEEFVLATDPHLCTFGRWFYSFPTDSGVLRGVLDKIEAPHSALHECAQQAQNCIDPEKRREFAQRADVLCGEQIVPLIDQLSNIYETVNKGTMIVLAKGEKTLGAFVDEVVSIQSVETLGNSAFNRIEGNTFVKNIVTAEGGVYLEIDVDALMAL